MSRWMLHGRVIAARTTATIVVDQFGAGSALAASAACTSNGIRWDYSALNHSASFAVKQQTYDNNGNQCQFDFIDPQEYLIGSITTVFERVKFGTTYRAEATWEVHGIVHSILGPDGVTTIGGSYQLRFTRTSSTPVVAPKCNDITTETLYAPGDSAAASVVNWSDHRGMFDPASTAWGDINRWVKLSARIGRWVIRWYVWLAIRRPSKMVLPE